jgi:sugar phosphate isomerase/epimerase
MRRTSRREFLEAGMMMAGGMALTGPGARIAQAAVPKVYGVQLYTVRDLLPTKPQETLKAIAAIGYKEVEMLRAALALMPMVAEAGLTAPGMHIEAPIVTGEWAAWEATAKRYPMPLPAKDYGIEGAIADAKKHGIQYLTVSYLVPDERTSLDFFRRFADHMNKAGETCRAAGLTLGYHSHAFEFEPLEGQVPMDILVARFDKQNVGFEIDVFWFSMGGRDPKQAIHDLGPRVRLLHLKDRAPGSASAFQESKVPPTAFAAVGSGELDFPGILHASAGSGVTHAFVEQDHCPGDPLDSLKQSYLYLAGLKL